MPGIVGLLTKQSREWAEPQLRKMLQTLCHEASYTMGTWFDESLGIYVGWVARERSFSDGMPLRNERGDVTLVFSGEEYPEPGAVPLLKKQGHDFNAEGPSYLVHLYEENPSFPAGLNGRFQGLVIDQREKKVTLFNDRYGLNRIYYREAKDAFYFAAEAKAILCVCPETRTPDYRGLGEFVACGCVLENRSLFVGIQVLPPASAWTFRNKAVERKCTYFEAKEWEDQCSLDQESYYKELREVFSANLPRYFKGSESIGMSLTGGLDTRMIMAWRKFAPGTLPCYTFGGPFRDCEDVQLARRIAHECRQNYQVIPVRDEYLSRFGHYAERTVYLSDGCANVRCSADLYANEIAAQIAPVRMTGNYGSEILRRLPAFKASVPEPGLYHRDFDSQLAMAKSTYAAAREAHALTFIAFRQTPWHHFGLLGLEQTQVSVRSPFLDNDLVRTAYRAPDASVLESKIFTGDDFFMRLIRDGDENLGKIRTDRGLGGTASNLSAKATRAMLEFTFKAEYAYDYGMPQAVARVDHLFSWLHLERLFLGRHKFLHFRVWYRNNLANYVRETLLSQRALSRPYLDSKGFEAAVRGHLKGNQNYTKEIHTALSLELLHRRFFD
jgi:asparagine synthase (glutamine-hydrolysing)